MRKLTAYIHISAPVQTVRNLTDADRRPEWMKTRGSVWLHTLNESWEATEFDGDTHLSLRMQYESRIPFLEPFVAVGYHQSVARSLSLLKQLAETPQV